MPNVPRRTATRASHRQMIRPSHQDGGYENALRGYQAVYEQISVDGTVGPGDIPPGTVNGGAITPGTLDITPFASSIRPVILVAADPTLPDADYPAGQFIYRTDINVLKKTEDGTTWVLAVGAGDIQANSITAGQIAAGAISTSELDAGAVTTDKLAAVQITIQDEFSQTVLDASGFTGTWADFVHYGLYNGPFSAGSLGALTTGRSVQLPYWDVTALSNATLTRTADATYPGGYRLRTAWSSLGSSVMYSDAVRVSGGAQYRSWFMYGYSFAGSGTGSLTVDVEWFDSSGASISVATVATVPATVGTVASTAYYSSPVTAPDNAFFAVVMLTVAESIHNAANVFDLGAMSLQRVPSMDLSDLGALSSSAALSISAAGKAIETTAGYIQVAEDGAAASQTYFIGKKDSDTGPRVRLGTDASGYPTLYFDDGTASAGSEDTTLKRDAVGTLKASGVLSAASLAATTTIDAGGVVKTTAAGLAFDTIDGYYRAIRDVAAGNSYFIGQTDTDTGPRARLGTDGSGNPTLFLDDGTAAVGSEDTNLYRSAADLLKTDDEFEIGIGGGKNTLALTSTAADTGVTIGGDVNLYRSAANVLKTDDSLYVGAGTYTNLRGVVMVPFVWTGTLAGTGTLDLPFFDSDLTAAQMRLPFAASVVGISVSLGTSRTAGTLDTQAYNGSSAALVGPSATIDGTTTNNVVATAVAGTADFSSSQLFRLRVTTTGFTPTANSVKGMLFLSLAAE